MKKTWFVAIIALLAIAVLGGYAVFDSIFPKVAPIKCPDIQSVTSVTLVENNGVSVTVETTDFEEILTNITNGQPTRAMSVNDYPTAKSYYTVEVYTEARQYRYFLYVENSQVYIEIPYEGIYKTDHQFLDFVAEKYYMTKH